MKVAFTAAAALLFVGASASLSEADYRARFSQWMREHNKEYTSGDEQFYRFQVFKANHDLVESHNRRYRAGEVSFFLGLNPLADMTNDEYRSTMLGVHREAGAVRDHPMATSFEAVSDGVPDSWDWRDHGAVNAVKNQGQCGSCWAFSATAAMEGTYFQNTGKLLSLSEQLCVDCVNGGADTCSQGGEMHDCVLQVVKEGGDESESAYPYTASSGGKCNFDKSKVVATFKGYKNVTSGDESALKVASSQHVVSVGIDASSFMFQLYSGGVFDDSTCKKAYDQLDHGVAVVGYGTDSGKDYWLVRNSWGGSWGLQGYIMMSRNKDNQCGIATDAIVVF